MPLTEELLQKIWPRDHEPTDGLWTSRRTRTAWNDTLKQTVRILYPDGGADGFRPPVSEFFTLVEVMARVHDGRARLPLDAAPLLDDLRGEIAGGLAVAVEGLRRHVTGTPHHHWLSSPDRPDVVITSNWDTLVELAAYRVGLEVHFTWPKKANGDPVSALPANAIVILKLHGSIDWGSPEDPAVSLHKNWAFEGLNTAILKGDGHPRRQHHRDGSETLLRYRSIDNPEAAGRSAAPFRSPAMATMSAGKDTAIAQIHFLWDDAYWCLSRAKRLDLVGYSFPADDLELRTLLRVSTRKPGVADLDGRVRVNICNPSPDVHDRARSFLGTGVASSYGGASGWKLTARRTRRARSQ